jgi:hypothetical protein
MKIIFEEKKVHFNGILNGEKVVMKVEDIRDKIVFTKIYPFSNPNLRGSISEIENNIEVLEIPLSSVSALHGISEQLQMKGFVEKLDYNLIQDEDWLHENRGIRLSITTQIVLDYMDVTAERLKGYPTYQKGDHIVSYLTEISAQHRAFFAMEQFKDQVLIEE